MCAMDDAYNRLLRKTQRQKAELQESYEKRKELERIIDDLKGENESLKDDIRELQYRIDSLEK